MACRGLLATAAVLYGGGLSAVATERVGRLVDGAGEEMGQWDQGRLSEQVGVDTLDTENHLSGGRRLEGQRPEPVIGVVFHLPTNNTQTKTISITTCSRGYCDDTKPSWFDWKEMLNSIDCSSCAFAMAMVSLAVPVAFAKTI